MSLALRLRLAAAVIIGLSLTSCKTAPTKVFESIDAKIKDNKNVSQPLKIADLSKDTVIVDARPAFDFAISHINGSVNIRWDEFTQSEESFRGLFEADLYFHARRLSRMGIGPDTPVVVVGRGPQGGGEEGRVAWTLRYLGVKNVKFAHIDVFDRPQTREEAPPKLSLPIWKPALDESLICERSTVLKKALVPQSDSNSGIMIDVRTASEYLGKSPSVLPVRPPDLGAINIPWTEFITSQGTVDVLIKEKLVQVGITPDREILVLSNHGVESATVTLVLRELGFAKAANYAGGYLDLVSEPKRLEKKKR